MGFELRVYGSSKKRPCPAHHCPCAPATARVRRSRAPPQPAERTVQFKQRLAQPWVSFALCIVGPCVQPSLVLLAPFCLLGIFYKACRGLLFWVGALLFPVLSEFERNSEVQKEKSLVCFAFFFAYICSAQLCRFWLIRSVQTVVRWLGG